MSQLQLTEALRLESAHTRGETIMRHWIVDARALIAKVKGETS